MTNERLKEAEKLLGLLYTDMAEHDFTSRFLPHWRARISSFMNHQPPSYAPEPAKTWEFDRYVNGRLMAEGVGISRAETFQEACQAAVALASSGSVLVVRQSSEPFEQPPAEIAWGLESKLPGEEWKVYWSLYSDRARAEQAAKNGRPEGTEWRVVTYARMPEGASRDASSKLKPFRYNEWGVPVCDCVGRPRQHNPDCPIGHAMTAQRTGDVE